MYLNTILTGSFAIEKTYLLSTGSNSGTPWQENIGQRTRSKLPLVDTPLEVIEQAFVPPDITIDMYEFECDNEDWSDFIKGFVQPLGNVARIISDLRRRDYCRKTWKVKFLNIEGAMPLVNKTT